MKLRSPHILLASSNMRRLMENIRHVLSKKSQIALTREINRNVIQLYRLGFEHFEFAETQPGTHWRQKISRYYYAAYGFSRAIRLHYDGTFSTEPSDHQDIGKLPDTFPNYATYSNKLKTLREDRNLADYSHDSKESDLVLSIADTRNFVQALMKDTKLFLKNRGIKL